MQYEKLNAPSQTSRSRSNTAGALASTHAIKSPKSTVSLPSLHLAKTTAYTSHSQRATKTLKAAASQLTLRVQETSKAPSQQEYGSLHAPRNKKIVTQQANYSGPRVKPNTVKVRRNIVFSIMKPSQGQPSSSNADQLDRCGMIHRRCGHRCCGISGESQCLPCLHPKCQSSKRTTLKSTMNDDCGICYTSELQDEACLLLDCGHVFHAECVNNLLEHRWSTLRITFDFLACPLCKRPIESMDNFSKAQSEIDKILALKLQVEELALKVYEKSKINVKPVLNPHSPWYRKPVPYVLEKGAFYLCYECKTPFFGGLADCERDLRLADTTKPEDLACQKCIASRFALGQATCHIHGHKHIIWKCHLCCAEAQYKCGNYYFCDRCHVNAFTDYQIVRDCRGKNCPLKVPHPPASKNPIKSMYPLGCSLCRQVGQAALKVKDVMAEQEFLRNEGSRVNDLLKFNPIMEEEKQDDERVKQLLEIYRAEKEEDAEMAAAEYQLPMLQIRQVQLHRQRQY